MAITFIDREGFETGGTEGLADEDGMDVGDSFTPPWNSAERFVCRIPNTV